MNINEVHWTCSNNVTKEHAKSLTVKFYDFFNTAVLMRMQSFMYVFLSTLGSPEFVFFKIDTFLLCTQ